MKTPELYELIGDGWRFPVTVQWVNSACAGVTICPIPLLKAQREAIVTLLRHISDHHTADPEEWFLSRTRLENNALRSSKTNPEDVVIWKREDFAVIADQSFIDGYCAYRHSIPGLRDPAAFKVIWTSITKFICEWMLYHEKPVDFGFASLHAFCARANWKSAVLGRLVAQGNNIAISASETTRREARRLLHQSFITAADVDSDSVCWSLDITPTPIFNEAAKTREMKRKEKFHGRSYAYQILKLLKSHHHKGPMYESLDAYAKEAQRPFTKLPHGFVPSGTDQGTQPALDPESPGHWLQSPVVTGQKMDDKPGLTLGAKDASLPPVPDLQPPDEDLRDSGEDVDPTGQS